MYAITGITGQVGGVVARALLAQGKTVRAVVRDKTKAQSWADRGCEIAVANLSDAPALIRAFDGVDGVFLLLPPTFDPTPGFPEARATIESFRQALTTTKPPRIVCLSTIGGQVERPNLLNQLHIMETVLGAAGLHISFLRAAWFMENSAWDVEPARATGVVPSFLQPLDKLYPMVATKDIGELAAKLLTAPETPARVIELEGPRRISPNDIAAAFSKVLGKKVQMQIVPRETWESLFRSQGMKNPEPRMQMLDGFNAGWIDFEGGEKNSLKGATTIDTVVRSLVAK
jgi:uncharacterized protein YbjT (DUF2867 family)